MAGGGLLPLLWLLLLLSIDKAPYLLAHHIQGIWQFLISSFHFLLQSSLSLGIDEIKCIAIFAIL